MREVITQLFVYVKSLLSLLELRHALNILGVFGSTHTQRLLVNNIHFIMEFAKESLHATNAGDFLHYQPFEKNKNLQNKPVLQNVDGNQF